MAERLFNAYQIADLLGLTLEEVAASAQKGDLPFHRMPDGTIRVPERGLTEFLRRQGVDLGEMYKRVAQDEVPLRPVRPAKAESRPAAPTAAPPAAADPTPSPSVTMAQWVKKICGTPPAAPQLPAAPEPAPVQVEPVVEPAAPAEPAVPVAEAAPKPEPEMTSQIVEAVLRDAVARKAQKVLLELKGGSLSLALAIDGRLHEKLNFQARLPAGLGPKVLGAFESLSAEPEATGVKRPAQFALDGARLPLELYSHPSPQGRRLVVRLADPGARRPALCEMGLAAEDELALARAMRHQTGGLILVAGAPRSGKRTVLAALADEAATLKLDATTVLTGEPGAFAGPCAVLADGQAGAMIALLARQGSSLLIVPDIADAACCREALRAAAGGTRVLAALECLTPAEAMEILLDHGLGGWPTATALRTAIWDRLVRKLCTCNRQAAPDKRLAAMVGLRPEEMDAPFHQPVGCNRCGGTGYSGRQALAAVWEPDASVRSAIRTGDAGATRRALAGFAALARRRAIDAARQGVTSLEELLASGSLE